jgi:alpha-L-fucosidase
MMNRRTLIRNLGLSIPTLMAGHQLNAQELSRFFSDDVPAVEGPFKPDWSSLSDYRCPDWYRDAKFGIWAHWGPQCQPEYGDWYAKNMYIEGSPQYEYHLKTYGHPSKFGFKDVINTWKAERWDPDALLSIYKDAGARYFFAMASHHDNLDLFDSKYQPRWNSTKVGPKKDIIGGWARAARRQGLPFGVSVHASHAWTWYEAARRADSKGPLAGVPYDGRMTKADGKGTWWEGLDPQELYAQQHPFSEPSKDKQMQHMQWEWRQGASIPDKSYIEKFYRRTIDLIDRYHPDLLYFDDHKLPFWPISDAGLRIAAHFYNRNIREKGQLQAVLNGKILDEMQRKCMVWDIERGQATSIEPFCWQTDTCIGGWHYDKRVNEEKRYKSAKTVIQMLADIVSKNGNLLLNIPVKGDGTIDEQERSIVEGIGRWMKLNGEAIYGTRPWKVHGEGPSIQGQADQPNPGFNEGKGNPLSVQDVRFTRKGNDIYAIVMGRPDDQLIRIRNLHPSVGFMSKAVSQVILLATGETLSFRYSQKVLEISLPTGRIPEDHTLAMKIS